MATRTQISAVLDQQMVEFLSSIGELDRVTEGKSRCSVCNDQISLESIALVLPAGKQVAYVCDKEMCMVQFALGQN